MYPSSNVSCRSFDPVSPPFVSLDAGPSKSRLRGSGEGVLIFVKWKRPFSEQKRNRCTLESRGCRSNTNRARSEVSLGRIKCFKGSLECLLSSFDSFVADFLTGLLVTERVIAIVVEGYDAVTLPRLCNSMADRKQIVLDSVLNRNRSLMPRTTRSLNASSLANRRRSLSAMPLHAVVFFVCFKCNSNVCIYDLLVCLCGRRTPSIFAVTARY